MKEEADVKKERSSNTCEERKKLRKREREGENKKRWILMR